MTQLQKIDGRLEWLKSYISWLSHVKVNNAMGGNMELCSFDQYLYSKHLDNYLFEDACLIPKITDELGKYWDQPDQRMIYIDNKKALMREREFNQLKNYSHTQPTGAYMGKMWKGQYADDDGRMLEGKWYLAWYGPHPTPGYVSNNYRDIEIIPERNYVYEMDEKRTLKILS